RATLRVAHGADDVPWLVKHEIDRGFGLDAAPVHLDAALPRIHAGPQLRHRLSVDENPPGDDELLGLPPRCDTGSGEDLLEALRGHGTRRHTRRTADGVLRQARGTRMRGDPALFPPGIPR